MEKKKINLLINSTLLTKIKLISFIKNNKIGETLNQIIEIGIKDFETNNKSINLNSFTKSQNKIID